jgi:FAD-dependent urate hydroxylase
MTRRASTDGTTPDRAARSERQDSPETGDRRHDRQVLVVGGSPTTLATAGFLEQAGLDPVLVPPPSERMQPDTLTLWRPGLVLLGRLGLRRPVEGIGTRLDRLDCPSAGSAWTTAPADHPSLVTVRRAALEDLLAGRIRGRVRTADRPVTGMDRTSDRVDVTFEGGIEESFDTVVTANPTLFPAVESRHGAVAIHVWAFDCPPGIDAPNCPVERWTDDLVAFSVPVGGDTHIRLVSATDPTHAATDIGALERRFGPLFDSSANPFEGLSQHAVQYHQFPRVVPASIHTDGVALVGPATRASLPGDCLRTTLGIEDAWVLADALAYGPRDRDDALDTYERRRRRRERELHRCPTADTLSARIPENRSPLLSRLGTCRTLAFCHVTGGQPPEVVEATPASL